MNTLTLHDMVVAAWLLLTNGILPIMGLILVVTGVGFVVCVLRDQATRLAYVALLRSYFRDIHGPWYRVHR